MRKQILYSPFILLFFLFACSKAKKVDINGTARGLDKTVVYIKKGDSVIAGANIKDGRFELHPYIMPDYYTLQIFYTRKSRPEEYPVYLEDRQYMIRLDTSAYKFPRISTNSSLQNELNEFYSESYRIKQRFTADYQKALYEMNYHFADAGPDKANAITDNLRISEERFSGSNNIAADSFIIRHPNFYASAYFLSGKESDISVKPDSYKHLFEKLDQKVKHSHYGKKAGELINYYLKGKVGSTVPDLAGETPDGKSFNRTLLRNKVTLIAFYATWNKTSVNELLNLKDIYQKYRKYGFEVLAISIDKNKENWQKFISANNLQWINISILKEHIQKILNCFPISRSRFI